MIATILILVGIVAGFYILIELIKIAVGYAIMRHLGL